MGDLVAFSSVLSLFVPTPSVSKGCPLALRLHHPAPGEMGALGRKERWEAGAGCGRMELAVGLSGRDARGRLEGSSHHAPVLAGPVGVARLVPRKFAEEMHW